MAGYTAEWLEDHASGDIIFPVYKGEVEFTNYPTLMAALVEGGFEDLRAVAHAKGALEPLDLGDVRRANHTPSVRDIDTLQLNMMRLYL